MSALVVDKEAKTELDKLGGLSLDDSNEFENRIDRSTVNVTFPNMEQFKQQMSSSPSLLSPMTSTPPPPSSSSLQTAGALKQNGYADEQTKLELQKQLEYYFSTKNLQNDSYLRSQMDTDDYVAISLISQFKRIKQLTSDMNLIISIIRQSSQLQLDPSNTRLRSVGGSAGGLITINTFGKKPSKSYINSSDQKALSLLQQQQRCVLILREVAPEATLEQIKDLFNNKEPDCPACHQCESAGNDSWYVTFNNEEQAQKALQYLKLEVQTFMDKPIRARIKAHTTIPRSTSSLLNNNNNNSNNGINNSNKISSLSPSSPPPSLHSSQNQPVQSQTPTQALPASYNQQLLAYDTPPSSSYMSQTSSPAPASIYSNTNQDLSYHDGSNIQLIVPKPLDFDMQSLNSNMSTKISNQSQQFNYLNYSNPQNLKYLPNGKPMNLISNQHYLFSPGPSINSPNGNPRPIIAQPNNQYWQMNSNSQVFTTPQKQSLKYNNDDTQSQSNVTINKQASTSSLSLNNNNSGDTFKSNESTEGEATKSFSSPNPNESHSITEMSSASLISYTPTQSMNQSILQIPNYYQTQQSQQPQMIQIPINSNNYNRSSPAAIQAFYQSLSQSPSQQPQQYIPLIQPNNNNQQSTPILSSTSSSSLNSVALSNQVIQQGSGQPITYSNLPSGYQQPQFIIQNSQYLNHQNVNQPAQISIISNSGGSAGGQLLGSGIALNSNFYNSNTKSSTPAPTSSGSSSNNTLSGSSNGAQQITSPPIYNPNSYFIFNNNNTNNLNNNSSNNNNPNISNNSNGTSVSAALTAAYQYYHSIQMNSAFPHQHPPQQYNLPNNQNLAQLNSYHSGMPPATQIYPGNQQPHQTQQSMPIFYEIVQPQYDSSSNPIPLPAFSQSTIPTNMQLPNQSQTNQTNETQNHLNKSSSENASTSTSNVSTTAANNLSTNTQSANTAPAIVAQTPVQLGNLIQQSAVQPQHTSPPTVFIYPSHPQNNLIMNQLNATTPQTLTANLGGTSSSNSNGQSVHAFNSSSISNGNARRVNSGNSNSSAELRNSSFGNQNHSNYQQNSHRSYNTNPRIKYMNNSNESSMGVISNQHHSNSHHHNHHPHSNQNFAQNMNSPSAYQVNKTYHQSVNSSNSHSVVSESTASSSRSSTSNTPLTLAANLNEMVKTTNDDSNNGHKIENEKPTQTSKSPPNNSDLVSFPPLLNSSNIPVNSNIQQQQRQTASNETSEMATEQLDPAIICISNTTLPSNPAIISTNTTNANKYTKPSGSLNKILATSSVENSSASDNSNNSPVTNQSAPVTNQSASVSNKHQSNIKYEMIKSHLGYNRTTNLYSNSNPDYYQQQKQPNNSSNNSNNNSNSQQHHHQMHQGSQANQIYNNNNMFKSAGASSGNHSRKSIDGIHSQNNNQRMHLHHGINQGGASISGKFYSNSNNERSSSTGGGGSNKNYHNRQNFSTNNQALNNNSAENKPSSINSSSALQTVINNENNQHVSSPSFNRKQKGSSNSHQNKGHSNQNYKDNSSKISTENNQKYTNTHSHTNVNSSDSSNLIAQSNSSLLSSSSSLQNNEDDMNSVSNNSWNNKKLTFAEIVQQKANSINGSENKQINQTAQALSQHDASSGCFSNTSSVSVTSANSSQATTPTVQPQMTSFAVPGSNTNSFTSSSDSSTINDQSQKASCFVLNQSNSPAITNSSIQV